jgi:hypothetical protein
MINCVRMDAATDGMNTTIYSHHTVSRRNRKNRTRQVMMGMMNVR